MTIDALSLSPEAIRAQEEAQEKFLKVYRGTEALYGGRMDQDTIEGYLFAAGWRAALKWIVSRPDLYPPLNYGDNQTA